MKNILVIDDDEDITTLLKLMLESAGHSCVTTNDARDGLELLRKSKFDLLLLDMSMPDMSGIEFLERIKKDQNLAGTKVLVVTASTPTAPDMQRIKSEYRILGMVEKPFNKSKLLGLIENC